MELDSKHIKNLLIITLSLWFIAFFTDKGLWILQGRQPHLGFDHSKIEKKIQTKISENKKIIDFITQKITELDQQSSDVKLSEYLFSIEKLEDYSKDFALFIYENDTLCYWSDHRIQIPKHYKKSPLENSSFLSLNNGYYLSNNKEIDNIRIVVLSLVKNNYSYTNDYLQNDFDKDLNIRSSIAIIIDKTSPGYKIKNKDGRYLFTLFPTKSELTDKPYFYKSVILYLFAIIFTLVYFYFLLKNLYLKRKNYIYLILFLLLTLLVRFLMIKFKIPANLYYLGLFSPSNFSESFWLQSFGDLLLNSLIIFVFAYDFYTHFENRTIFKFFIEQERKKKSIKFNRYLFVFVGFIFLLLFITFIQYVTKSLIFNSSVSFEIHKVVDISFYTFIGFFTIALLFTAFIIFTDKLFLICSELITFHKALGIIFLSTVIFTFSLYDTKYQIENTTILIYLIIVSFVYYLRYQNKKLQYYNLIFILFFITLYNVVVISNANIKKEKDIRLMHIETLTVETDMGAEFHINKIGKALKNHENIKSYLKNHQKNEIEQIIEEKYMCSLLDKFEFNVSICHTIDTGNVHFPACYKNFQKQLNRMILPISGSLFLIDNPGSRICYIKKLSIKLNTIKTAHLFIEFNTRYNAEELGYPDLLLEQRLKGIKKLSGYSYAKYSDNKLVTHTGSYHYNLNSKVFGVTGNRPTFVKQNGYSHLVYKADERNTVVLSLVTMRSIDFLITFSYIFLFNYLFLTFLLVIKRVPQFLGTFRYDLKFRIQFSMITIVSVSLLIIGGGTVFYNLNQYQNKNNQIIEEKLKTTQVVFERYFAQNTKITKDWKNSNFKNLNKLLHHFSSIFFTDVHLYDVTGKLLATTRSEVLTKKIMGYNMDPEAYKYLIVENQPQFIHNEKIGLYNYYSSYIPLKNQRGQVVAYLNLPYFTKQSKLKQELSPLIVAIINVYGILIFISIVVAIFIANKISQPLRLIQDSFEGMQFGKTNEYIMYDRDDEIGNLIKGYNHMVAQLEKSAELLAKSEREGAWREMARQIAHEIKNPLTPMKLSVQFLERAWAYKDEKFEKRLKKVCNTLIEQIERLSAIASSFSDFAKISKAKNEIINIIEIVEKCLNLYENTQNVKFSTNIHYFRSPIFIFADKDQLSRAFINIIRNAMQAMRENKQAKISVELLANENHVIVKFIDNGTGISDEIKEKLFVPSFTTKSSGMGLGLAIVKNIIQNAGGRIWFKTRVGKGTTFFVEFPIYSDTTNKQIIKIKNNT